jgi:hypothetical protein
MIIDGFGTEQTYRGQYTRFECMMNENLEPGLPKEQRLSVISSVDSTIGTITALTLQSQKDMSGFDCGEDFDCRQPNGAGYFLFDSVGESITLQPPAFGVSICLLRLVYLPPASAHALGI